MAKAQPPASVGYPALENGGRSLWGENLKPAPLSALYGGAKACPAKRRNKAKAAIISAQPSAKVAGVIAKAFSQLSGFSAAIGWLPAFAIYSRRNLPVNQCRYSPSAALNLAVMHRPG